MIPRPDITPEVEKAICDDYERGHKAIVIYEEYKISSGLMYNILHRHKIPLRKALAPATIKPKEETLAGASIIQATRRLWRPGEFMLTIVEADFEGLSDDEFLDIWAALGVLVRNISQKRKAL